MNFNIYDMVLYQNMLHCSQNTHISNRNGTVSKNVAIQRMHGNRQDSQIYTYFQWISRVFIICDKHANNNLIENSGKHNVLDGLTPRVLGDRGANLGPPTANGPTVVGWQMDSWHRTAVTCDTGLPVHVTLDYRYMCHSTTVTCDKGLPSHVTRYSP